MELVAVFDIGSTKFRYAAAATDGTFRTEPAVDTTRPRRLARQLCDAVTELRAATTRSLDAVAVSTTGLVEKEAGVVHQLDTPDGGVVSDVDLRSGVQATHELPVSVENDCNAAALGEWYYGARADQNCLVHITFGTGIGGGVVERGRLVRGEAAQAGEFGLLPLAPDHELASTGVQGAWEAFCSGRGIPQYVDYRLNADGRPGGASESALRASDRDSDLSAEDVFAAAADGDAFAQACLDQISRYNAAGLAAVCNAVNPGVVTIGGGVALQNPEVLLDGIDAALDEYLFVDRPTIRVSPLGHDIGLYGALATALNDHSTSVVAPPALDTA